VILDGGVITAIHLSTRGAVPGVDGDAFQRLAEDAKDNCPVSKVLAAADITLEAVLE